MFFLSLRLDLLNTYKEMFLLFIFLTTGKQVVVFFQMVQLFLIFVRHSLKLASAIFYQIFIFYQMIAFQKL